jgi:hypothetical protein
MKFSDIKIGPKILGIIIVFGASSLDLAHNGQKSPNTQSDPQSEP